MKIWKQVKLLLQMQSYLLKANSLSNLILSKQRMENAKGIKNKRYLQ